MNDLFQLFLVAMRIIGAFLFLPIFRGNHITMRTRAAMVFLLAALLLPSVQHRLPTMQTATVWSQYAAIELLIGTIFGFVIQIYYSSLYTLGSIISMQSGLSAASMFDPSQKEQVAIFTNLFAFIAMAYFLVADVHHSFILGIAKTYDYWQCGIFPEMTSQMVEALGESMRLAFQIASPFLIVEIAILLGSGVLAKLMPTLQVFFVVTPIQILVTFCIVFIVLNQIIELVLEHIMKLL